MDNRLIKELYEKYSRELYRYLYSLCRSREMAEDILHDVFCKAILSLPDGHTNVRAWLYIVGRNLMFNAMRRRKRERPHESDGADPDRDIYEAEFCRNEPLYEALLKLDERKREILLLTYFDGFTLREAAGLMRISYENARVLSHRAKRELRKMLEVDGYEV